MARTDINNGGRKQEAYFTYGLKAFGAERLPSCARAQGFNERVIVINCFEGNPEFDISEILNEDENKKLRDELYNARNELLIHKIIHQNKKFGEVITNLQNREKQLFKPLVKIFCDSDIALNDLERAITGFIRRRREETSATLEFDLYYVVKDLITEKETNQIESTAIWNALVQRLPGEAITGGRMSYNSEQHGIISQNKITKMLIEMFGARKSPGHGNLNTLIFNTDKLAQVGMSIERPVDVEIRVRRTEDQVGEWMHRVESELSPLVEV